MKVKELIQRIELQCFKCPFKRMRIETPIDHCLLCKEMHKLSKDKSREWFSEAMESETAENKEN